MDPPCADGLSTTMTQRLTTTTPKPKKDRSTVGVQFVYATITTKFLLLLQLQSKDDPGLNQVSGTKTQQTVSDSL